MMTRKTNSLIQGIMNEKVYAYDKFVCSERSEHISFEHYSLLNTLWRLSFTRGTRFTITIPELLDAFLKATPEYKDSSMQANHLEGMIKYLEQRGLISYDLHRDTIKVLEGEQATIILFFKPICSFYKHREE